MWVSCWDVYLRFAYPFDFLWITQYYLFWFERANTLTLTHTRTLSQQVIIYLQFLAVPFGALVLWLLIPVSGPITFSVLAGAFFLASYLSWQIFFDMIMPNVGFILYLMWFIIYAIGLAIIFAILDFGGTPPLLAPSLALTCTHTHTHTLPLHTLTLTFTPHQKKQIDWTYFIEFS